MNKKEEKEQIINPELCKHPTWTVYPKPYIKNYDGSIIDEDLRVCNHCGIEKHPDGYSPGIQQYINIFLKDLEQIINGKRETK